MTTKKRILIDFDDCIGDFAPFICSYMNVVGKKSDIAEYKTYEFNLYHGMTNDQFIESVINSRAFKLLQPRIDAIRGLQLLKLKGYEIIIVTARGMFERAFEDTKEWLDTYGAPYDELRIVDPSKEKKSDVYLEYGLESIAGLVDDALHNLKDASEVGVIPLCINRPWNEDASFELHRFESIMEIAEKLPNTVALAA